MNLDMLKPYLPYLSCLTLLIAIVRFILDEIRLRQKKKAERLRQLEETKEKSAYPPRKDKHRKR